ncbi:MAG: 3-keto-5-aminohexanoate cleavage protein [Phycisphaerales bacterium]|nr:MAG: 3-keto-5-aminohexanoate cleavage protein [Phycisphaerales bacterium]
MKRKVVIAVAPVKNPGTPLPEHCVNPLTPEQVAEQTLACARAGAAMVHLHVRDEKGEQTGDLAHFSRTLDLIRQESEIVIQGSTGGLSTLTLEERCVALNDERVQMASLNMGSTNFGDHVYINTLPDIRYWAQRMLDTNVIPECEIFALSMIDTISRVAKEGLLHDPIHYNFALGFASSLAATPDNLYCLKSALPVGATWGLVHDGMRDFSLLATALAFGATIIRVGFEDGCCYQGDLVARSNEELVKQCCELVERLGFEVATLEEAKEILLT